jgi:predicted trehalose synthase
VRGGCAESLSARHDALHKSLVLRQVLSAACFDAEDRALAEAHIQTCLRSLLDALTDAPRVAQTAALADTPRSKLKRIQERMALLSFASEQNLLPSSSALFESLVKKQVQLTAGTAQKNHGP